MSSFKSSKSGSPRGWLYLFPAGSNHTGPTEEEIEEKKDPRGKIQDELEKIQKKSLTSSKRGSYRRGSFYEKNQHPYIDTCPRDNTPHLFTLHQETDGFNTSRPGYAILTVDGKDEAYESHPVLFKFFGSAYDFAHESMKAIPHLSHVLVCQKDIVPYGAKRVLTYEYPKVGVKFIDNTKLDNGQLLEKIQKEEKDYFKSKDKQKSGLSMKDVSKIQDPYHKVRGFSVASKIGSKMNRIMKIAYYVARTPEDEQENENQEWAIFPDEPTEANEPDTIAKFPTRDEAVKEMHKMQKDKEVTANIMHDWMTPEEAVVAAWSLRKKDKDKNG